MTSIEFQGNEYTLKVGNGALEVGGQYEYTTATNKLVLHDRATGVTATWPGTAFRTLGSANQQSVSALRPRSDGLLGGSPGCLLDCVSEITFAELTGCGDEDTDLSSEICIRTGLLTGDPSSAVAPAGPQDIRLTSTQLLVANRDTQGETLEEARCKALKSNIDQVTGSLLGAIDNALDEASGVFGEKNLVLIHANLIRAQAFIIRLQELLKDFINGGCARYYPGYAEEIQRDIEQAERDIQLLQSRLEQRSSGPDIGAVFRTALNACVQLINAIVAVLAWILVNIFRQPAY